MNNISVSFLTGRETDPDEENAVENNYSTAIGAFIFSLVFLLGVPGNLFIVWSILARIRQRSVTTLLILNLACADGFLMALSIFFIIYLAMQSWVFGNTMCKIVFYLCNSNMYASVFLITLMSVNRLLAVVFPHTLYHLITRKVVRRVILGTWVLVMAISIPSLVFRDVKEETDDMNQTTYVCVPNHTLRRHSENHFYAFQTVAGFIIPYAIIITSYVLILKRLRETRFQRNFHSEKLILAIIIMFGLFWLPYHVINIVQVCKGIFSTNNPITTSNLFNNGFAFMAKLFEGTSSETGTKTTRFTATDDLGKNNVVSENHKVASTLQNRC
uniref:Leukotriene B4 receptor 2b n=1 Tax=Neolamprologus brichardi TaxID=32507 RepID=A0A3Q4MWG1_NEOBR